jgi:nucleoside-diphosphate-sugar epimerase
MAVLITGGYGLLGSWLVYEFAHKGEDVIVLDAVQKWFDYLEGLEEKITYEYASVLDFPRMVSIFERNRERIGGIIHTVAAMATPNFWSIPHGSINLNIMGTANLLELARLFDINKFVYISSGAVYGEFNGKAHELDYHTQPTDLYGASKASAELLGQQYESHYGIDYRCIRPYFFFGPGKFPSEQTYLFRNLLGPLEGLAGLRLERGADQSLGFTYVRDTARGTYLLYEARNPVQKTVNIASEVPVAFPEIVRLAKKYSLSPTEVALGPGKLFPHGETLDISIAKKELGFRPLYGIEEAMKEYAEWLQRNRMMQEY